MVKGKGIEGLSEDEKKALRGSKFAPLPPSKPSSSFTTNPRVPHPGGPVTTNKAFALAKFLQRKLEEPGGLDNVKPELIELAVKDAKETVKASGTTIRGVTVRHVTSFEDSEETSSHEDLIVEPKKKKIRKDKDKKMKQKENKEKKRLKKKNKNKKAKDL